MSSKRIVLGVSGGIAAYKAAELARLLIKQGHKVRVVMTKSALEFIKPLTFEALTGEKVFYKNFDDDALGSMAHIELAKWPEAIIIAPATANVIAKITHGIADDLLTSICLAATAPLIIAPAMNRYMWSNVATQENIAKLRARGVRILGPGTGEQACGDVGEGRLLEPELIAAHFSIAPLLKDKRVVITAGPTVEAIDPVRFLSNRSSGKMGYALAEVAQKMGASVTLLSGPTALDSPFGVKCVQVESAAEMHDAVMARLEGVDVFIGAAAVCDYAPLERAAHKLKKQENEHERHIELKQNRDIIADVVASKKAGFVLGFAAETENVLAFGKDKLKRKGLDAIVINNVADDAVFNQQSNAGTLIFKDGTEISLKRADKKHIAELILMAIAK